MITVVFYCNKILNNNSLHLKPFIVCTQVTLGLFIFLCNSATFRPKRIAAESEQALNMQLTFTRPLVTCSKTFKHTKNPILNLKILKLSHWRCFIIIATPMVQIEKKKNLEENLCKYGNKCLCLKQVTQIREISAI